MNRRQVNSAIRKLLDKQVQRSFASQAFERKAWKPLKKPRRTILVKSGKLKSSFKTRQLGRNIIITSSVNYAKYHNWGTDKIPQRQMVGFTPTVKKQIQSIFYEYFTETLKRTYTNNYRKR